MAEDMLEKVTGSLAQGVFSGVNALATGAGALMNGAGALMRGAGHLMEKASEDLDFGKVTDSIRNVATVSNGVKLTTTITGTYVGSTAGTIGLTGLGFALGGPPGAVLGYISGHAIGGGVGAVAGYKGGKLISKQMDLENGPKQTWKRDTVEDFPVLTVAEDDIEKNDQESREVC